MDSESIDNGGRIMKKAIGLFVAIALVSVLCSTALAQGQGLIRIDPHGSYYPEAVMLSSPATFTVYVESGGDAYDPHIFLVMTESSYNGLTGDVTIDWGDGPSPDLTITSWNMETDNSVKVPPDTDSGVGYTVASLKDHLDTDGPIYWAFEPFLDSSITETPTEFTVMLPSDSPRMMVYALGKAEETDTLFSNRVPPTQPGFVIPEVGTLLMALASLSAFVIYGIKRGKKSNTALNL